MAHLTELTVRDYLALVRWYALSLFVGLCAVVFYPESWRFAEVIHKAGDALMVAGVIGTVVELSSLNRLIEHVGRDVARRISAAHLPAEIRGQIWGMANTNLVYEDYQRSYRLTRRPDGRLDVESTITYKVRNFGFVVEPYSPTCAEERFYHPRFLNVEYRLASGPGHAFSELDLAAYTKTRPLTQASCVDDLPKLVLGTKDTMPNEVCTVSWRLGTIWPAEASDITAFGGPTINPVIQVDAKPADVEFVSEDESAERLAGGTRWLYRRPFIKGQHVRVWWFSKGTEASVVGTNARAAGVSDQA